jgi:hypothetical protein
MDLRGNMSTRSKQCVAYADDILIISRTEESMVETFSQLKEQSEQLGLIINHDKTKYLKCKEGKKDSDDITANEDRIQQVESFKYFGSLVNKDNAIEEEIKERIMIGTKALHMNAALLKGKLISKSAKLRQYNSVIKPTATYACETRVLKEYDGGKLLAFENKILKKMYGPYREKDYTWKISRNGESYRVTGKRNIINFNRSHWLRWFGHVHRMDNKRLVRKIYKWKPLGTRTASRPKHKWEDDVMTDLQLLKIKNWTKGIQN